MNINHPTYKFFPLADVNESMLFGDLWVEYANRLRKSHVSIKHYRVVNSCNSNALIFNGSALHSRSQLYIGQYLVGEISNELVGNTVKTHLSCYSTGARVSINRKILLDYMLAHFVVPSAKDYVHRYGVELKKVVLDIRVECSRKVNDSLAMLGSPLDVVHGLLYGEGDSIPLHEFERQFSPWINAGYFAHKTTADKWGAFEHKIHSGLTDGMFVLYNSGGGGVIINLRDMSMTCTDDVVQAFSCSSTRERFCLRRVTDIDDVETGLMVEHDPYFSDAEERTLYYIP